MRLRRTCLLGGAGESRDSSRYRFLLPRTRLDAAAFSGGGVGEMSIVGPVAVGDRSGRRVDLAVAQVPGIMVRPGHPERIDRIASPVSMRCTFKSLAAVPAAVVGLEDRLLSPMRGRSGRFERDCCRGPAPGSHQQSTPSPDSPVAATEPIDERVEKRPAPLQTPAVAAPSGPGGPVALLEKPPPDGPEVAVENPDRRPGEDLCIEERTLGAFPVAPSPEPNIQEEVHSSEGGPHGRSVWEKGMWGFTSPRSGPTTAFSRRGPFLKTWVTCGKQASPPGRSRDSFCGGTFPQLNAHGFPRYVC